MKAKQQYHFETRKFHFYNCYICGWKNDGSDHISGRNVHSFNSETFRIPISVDQKVFKIDVPTTPHFCTFGNTSMYDREQSKQKPYINFEFLCNMNEHIVDHGPGGKACMLIEIKFDDTVEQRFVKEHIASVLETVAIV